MTVRPTITDMPPEMLEKIFSYVTDSEVFQDRKVCRVFCGIIDGILERKYPFFSLLQKLQGKSDLFKSEEMDELLRSPNFLEKGWSEKIFIGVKLAERALKAINHDVTENDLKAPRLPKVSPIEQLMHQALWLESQKRRSYSGWVAAVQQKGEKLEDVPLPLRDRKLCLVAARQTVFALKYVPDELRDRDMFLATPRYTLNGRPMHLCPEEYADQMREAFKGTDRENPTDV